MDLCLVVTGSPAVGLRNTDKSGHLPNGRYLPNSHSDINGQIREDFDIEVCGDRQGETFARRFSA